MFRRSNARAAAILAVCFPLIAGCVVTEKLPNRAARGMPVTPGPNTPALPTGDAPPIASPLPSEGNTSAQARFEVLPLGEIRYNGLTLPLVSPNGRYVASQIGNPPSWGVLAGDEPGVADLARIRVYELVNRSITELDFTKGEVTPAAALPGLLLGRCVDDGGFFVEFPRADGSRWLGWCEWTTGNVRWIVGGDERTFAFAAHAVRTRTGRVFYVTRSSDASPCSLAVIESDGTSRRVEDSAGQWLCPLAPIDEETIALMRLDSGELSLRTLRIPAGTTDTAPSKQTGRIALATQATPAQAMFCVLSMVPCGAAEIASADGFAAATFYHPWSNRMCLVTRTGDQLDMPKGSMAAALRGRELFLSMPKALMYSELPQNWPSRTMNAPMSAMQQPMIPRAYTVNGGWTLVGPASNSENRLRIVKLGRVEGR